MQAPYQKPLTRRCFWGCFLSLGILAAAIFLCMDGSPFQEIMAPHHRDVFARESILIEPGRIIGRLIVTDGDATVGGVVTKGVFVVDGDLVLTATAEVKGMIIVLGGSVVIEETAKVEKMIFTVTSASMPLAGTVVKGILLFGAFLLVALPVVIWFLAGWLKKHMAHKWLRKINDFLQEHGIVAYTAAALLISGLMLAFFAELAWETLFRYQMDAFDSIGIWLIQYYQGPWLNQVMTAFSDMGYGYPFLTITIGTFLTLVFFRRRLELAGLALCLGGSALLNVLLKQLFSRSRPELFLLTQADGYSFPSGHAMVSLCFYGMLGYLLARHLQNNIWRLLFGGVCWGVIMAIGISRIYLGVHYPTDVIAGYVAGTVWLAFCISYLLWREQRK